MKKIFTLFVAVLLTASVFAQSPEKMSYQAVIRNSSDVLVTDTQIGMQISILHGTADGSPVYVETQTPTTNSNGLVSVEIGTGTTSDDFATIDWTNGPYYIKTETDPAGSTDYTITGTSQLLSVPYALHAKTSETVTGTITEADPAYTSSQAANITATDITNLGNLSGTNTGDQDISGIAINSQAIQDTASQIRADIPDVSGFITEENQTLSISGSQLTIENGNTITLPAGGSSSIPVYTATEITALSPAQGDAVFNSTENLYQVYVNSAWQSFNANCWPQPTTANAGTNQTFTDGTITTTLAANAPEPNHGTGQWSILSGEGGSFNDATEPTATFSGQLYKSYELQWSITTSCDVSSDNVIVSFYNYVAGETITDIDGNTYNTVWIGTQQWMAENLKTTKYNNGTNIQLVTDSATWTELTTPGYCWYDNDQATYGDTYGALYNWYTVETGNLCPDGWHVPTDAEWTQLTDYLGGESVAGGKLKEAGTTHWNSPNEGATNESGFTALPGAYRSNNGFLYVGRRGNWWSATEDNTYSWAAWYRDMNYDTSDVYRGRQNKENGFSVRCLRD